MLFLEGTPNDTYHCEIIIYKGLPRFLTMNIYNKMYKVIMHKSTVNSTSEIWYFIGIHTEPYRSFL